MRSAGAVSGERQIDRCGWILLPPQRTQSKEPAKEPIDARAVVRAIRVAPIQATWTLLLLVGWSFVQLLTQCSELPVVVLLVDNVYLEIVYETGYELTNSERERTERKDGGSSRRETD